MGLFGFGKDLIPRISVVNELLVSPKNTSMGELVTGNINEKHLAAKLK